MPNWTENRLTVEGGPSDLRVFAEAARSLVGENGDDPAPLDFERHVPTPPEYLAEKHVPRGSFPAWHTWRREHWGTKWNAMSATVEGKPDEGWVTYRFSTAWTPPEAWLRRVSRAHRELRFHHEYVEELAHFAGTRDLGGRGVGRSRRSRPARRWVDRVGGARKGVEMAPPPCAGPRDPLGIGDGAHVSA